MSKHPKNMWFVETNRRWMGILRKENEGNTHAFTQRH